MSTKKTSGKSANKPKVYDFDFVKHAKASSCISVSKNQLVPSPYFKEDVLYNLKESPNPRQFYVIGNRVFAFTHNSKIGEYKDLIITEISLTYYSAQPQLLAVNDGGENKILLVNEEFGEILGERLIKFGYKVGQFLTYVNKRLFYAKENVIYFSDEFDYVSEIESTEPTGYIVLDQDLGNVEGMYLIGQSLQVVCTHGIVVLTLAPSPSQYTLKRINCSELEVIPNSVVTHGSHTCFLSDIYFCIFDGNKVNFYQMFERPIKVIATGEHIGFYIINYLENITNKTMVIEISTRENFHLPYHWGISKKGGYARSPKSKASVFSREKITSEKCQYESAAVDFNSVKEKWLVGIEVYAFERTNLTISGDFGELCLEVRGYLEYKCNEKSKNFYVKCEMSQGALPFRNLRLKYKILGE